MLSVQVLGMKTIGVGSYVKSEKEKLKRNEKRELRYAKKLLVPFQGFHKIQPQIQLLVL